MTTKGRMRRLSFLPEQLPQQQQQQQQQQQNQRRPARRRSTVTNRVDADGLLGSLRRFSLDSHMDHDQGKLAAKLLHTRHVVVWAQCWSLLLFHYLLVRVILKQREGATESFTHPNRL